MSQEKVDAVERGREIALNDPEIEWLVRLRNDGPRKAFVRYSPAAVTSRLGLVDRRRALFGYVRTFSINENGLQWLKDHGL